jgi:hypothetical protein
MGRLGQALEAAGVTAVGVVRPPAGARRGWDAADADDTTVCELVADAMLRWIGPVT